MNYCLVKGLISLASPEQAAILWGESSVVALALLLAEALRFPAIERCAVGQSRPKRTKQSLTTDHKPQCCDCVVMQIPNDFPHG